MFQAEDSRNHCGQTLEGTDKYMLSCSYLKVREICFLWYTLNPPSSLFKNLIWSTFSYFFTLLEFLVIYQTLSVIHYINCGFHYLPLRYVCLFFFFFSYQQLNYRRILWRLGFRLFYIKNKEEMGKTLFSLSSRAQLLVLDFRSYFQKVALGISVGKKKNKKLSIC